LKIRFPTSSFQSNISALPWKCMDGGGKNHSSRLVSERQATHWVLNDVSRLFEMPSGHQINAERRARKRDTVVNAD